LPSAPRILRTLIIPGSCGQSRSRSFKSRLIFLNSIEMAHSFVNEPAGAGREILKTTAHVLVNMHRGAICARPCGIGRRVGASALRSREAPAPCRSLPNQERLTSRLFTRRQKSIFISASGLPGARRWRGLSALRSSGTTRTVSPIAVSEALNPRLVTRFP